MAIAERLPNKEGLMPMEVIVAQPHGFCGNENFGVTGAIRIAEQTAREHPRQTYLLGEIVHNPHVVEDLEQRCGIKTVSSLGEVPDGATVVIRAHGEPPETFQEIERRGLNYRDGTCRMVKTAQNSIRKIAEKGGTVVYIASKKDHEEAVGAVGQARKSVILTTLKELLQLEIPDPQNTTVVTQTTLSVGETKEELERLKERYPHITVQPHICKATTDRQRAVAKLAKEVEVVVVVGSPGSSNTQRLGEVAKKTGGKELKVIMADTAAELNPEDFKGVKKVGVTSGASTPEELLKEVVAKIKDF